MEWDLTKGKANFKRQAQTTKDAAQNILSAEMDHGSQAAAVDGIYETSVNTEMFQKNQ